MPTARPRDSLAKLLRRLRIFRGMATRGAPCGWHRLRPGYLAEEFDSLWTPEQLEGIEPEVRATLVAMLHAHMISLSEFQILAEKFLRLRRIFPLRPPTRAPAR